MWLEEITYPDVKKQNKQPTLYYTAYRKVKTKGGYMLP